MQPIGTDEWIVICSFLQVKELINYQLVCKECYVIGESDLLWKKHYDTKLENQRKVKIVLEDGFASHASILGREYPNQNYKLNLMQICELQNWKFTLNYEYQSYNQILNKPMKELNCPITHMKVAILGIDSGVTSLLRRLGIPQSSECLQYHTTIDERKFCIEFVDVCSSGYNSKQNRLLPTHLYGSDLIVATFPFVGNSIMGNLQRWIDCAHHYMPKTPTLIIGTKSDLKTIEHDKIVLGSVINKYCRENNCLSYYEISAQQDSEEKMVEFVELCIKSVLLTHRNILNTKLLPKKKQCSIQ